MAFISVFLVSGLVILGMMILLWLVSLLLKNSSIVDIFWGTGFVITTWVAFLMTPDGFILRKLSLSLLVTIWGLRLSLHILTRNWGKPEDFRYQAWRKEAGAAWWWRSFFKVFLLQGVLLWIISTPVLAAQVSALPGALTWLDFLAIPLWLVGFTFEAVGDWQLRLFKANPANKGKVLSAGVWRYTRHPNYFGDACIWFGLWLVACDHPLGFVLVVSPLLMTYFLVKVTGKALLERRLKRAKPEYAAYIARTSGFFPLPPNM